MRNSFFQQVLLAAAIPLALHAQNPVNLTLTPIQPVILPGTDNPSDVTLAPGSVTLKISGSGGGTARISVQLPATVAAIDAGDRYQLDGANFTISIENSGLGFQAALVPPTTTGLTGYGCEFSSDASCFRPELIKVNGSPQTVSVRMNAQVLVFTATVHFAIAFQWTATPGSGCSALPSGLAAKLVKSAACGLPLIEDMDVVQETTYNPTLNDDTKAVTLIAAKPTMVRVYATSQTPVKNVTALLHGSLGTSSTELGKALNPMDGPMPIQSTFTLPKAANRDDAGASFNFLLPDNWTAAGDLTLRAELVLPPGTPADPAHSTFTQAIHFTTGAASLSIAYTPFCYLTTSGCGFFRNQLGNEEGYLKTFYPISPANVHYSRLFLPGSLWTTPIDDDPDSPDDGGFLAHLEKIFQASSGRKFDQLVGWLPEISGSSLVLRGMSDPSFFPYVGHGHVAMMMNSAGGDTLAHEIGHNQGLRHPGLTRFCGDVDIFDLLWPYKTPYTQQPGFDFTAKTLRPGSTGDLMSYCRPQSDRGISPYDVHQLLQNGLVALAPVKIASPPPLPARLRTSAAAATAEQVLISGWVQRDGSAGWLDPLYRLPSDGTAPPSVDGDSHCLHFSGASGDLGEYCFQLGFQGVDGTVPVNRRYFTLLAPLPAGATRIALMAAAHELTALTASSAAPALTMTSPQKGDIWNPGMQTIAWSASSADNRPLVFTVLYSSDGGQSWLPMALDIQDPQFTFDPAQIVGGSNVFFRVMATDGMNSTSADIGPIQVNQTPTINAPASLTFANAVPGDASIQTLTISNSGSGPLMVDYTLDNPAFSVLSPATVGIGAGESRDLRIRWSPTDAGSQTASLTLNSNDPANPSVTVHLAGTAAATPGCRFGLSSSADPAASLGGPGTVNVSASADDCAWTAAANVPWVSITAGASGTGDGQVAFTVAANAAFGERTGTLTIAGQTYTVYQTAAAPATAIPTISISTNSLKFGPVALGQPPSTMKFTITNTGQADLHIRSITQTGDPSFSLVPVFSPLTLAAAKSADITVQFAPKAAGNLTGSLSIASDDSDPTHNPLTVSLSGTANPAATGGGCLPPPPNLVSWWSGDGNANDSGAGNNLSVQGGTTFAAGEVGQAFQFDGSTGYVSAGNAANLRLTSAITVEAWIYPRTSPTAGNMQAILTKWAQIFQDTADSDSYGLWFRNDATAGLSLFGAIHQAGGAEPHVLGGTIPLNAWTHVAMTFDSTTGQFLGYVNGQVVSTLTAPGAIFPSSRNVFIGREDSIQPRPFNGLIDELSVYGRALNASEIQTIYSAGSAGKCKTTTPGGGATRVALTVDSSTFAASVGLPNGAADTYFVNRLTPPTYPATLRGVQIAFSNAANALPAGSPIAILSGSNPSGSAAINGIALTRVPAQIAAVGAIDSYDVAPITITSGDFVVGFDAGYAKGLFPAALDTAPPSRMRSYFSTDGTTFAQLDSAGTPGNLGIRAVVDLVGSGGGTAPPQIAVTPAALDFGSVPVGQQSVKTLTIRNAGGGTLTVTSLGILDNPLFSIVQPPPAPFDVPAAGVTLNVQFTPVAASAGTLLKGTLTIGSNDPARTAPLQVAINGTGTSSTPGPSGVCVPPPANVVSWWSGEGNAGDSGSGNSLGVQGGTTFAAGKVGQAFQFDGSTGYASAGNPANLRLTSALTVEAWINPRSAPTTGNMQAILTKWAQIFQDTPDSDSYGMWFRNDATAGLTLYGAIHQAGGAEPHVLGGAIPLNAWTHVAMTFDSTTGTFTGYVNGQAVSTLTSPGAIVTSSRNVFIGREDSLQPRPFNGLIDEVTVFSRALSTAEIQAIYTAGAAGKCKSPSGAGQ